jgi:hypothetical protein
LNKLQMSTILTKIRIALLYNGVEAGNAAIAAMPVDVCGGYMNADDNHHKMRQLVLQVNREVAPDGGNIASFQYITASCTNPNPYITVNQMNVILDLIRPDQQTLSAACVQACVQAAINIINTANDFICGGSVGDIHNGNVRTTLTQLVNTILLNKLDPNLSLLQWQALMEPVCNDRTTLDAPSVNKIIQAIKTALIVATTPMAQAIHDISRPIDDIYICGGINANNPNLANSIGYIIASYEEIPRASSGKIQEWQTLIQDTCTTQDQPSYNELEAAMKSIITAIRMTLNGGTQAMYAAGDLTTWPANVCGGAANTRAAFNVIQQLVLDVSLSDGIPLGAPAANIGWWQQRMKAACRTPDIAQLTPVAMNTILTAIRRSLNADIGPIEAIIDQTTWPLAVCGGVDIGGQLTVAANQVLLRLINDLSVPNNNIGQADINNIGDWQIFMTNACRLKGANVQTLDIPAMNKILNIARFKLNEQAAVQNKRQTCRGTINGAHEWTRSSGESTCTWYY